MTKAIHVSDLHGKKERYDKLFDFIQTELPQLVFISGDLYPPFNHAHQFDADFFDDCLVNNFNKLKNKLKEKYPAIFIILGNDDPAVEEERFKQQEYAELWKYVNFTKTTYKGYTIFGYSFIPPTPFRHKDWEVYDLSRYVDPGCIHPTEGKRSVDPGRDIEYTTIKNDLSKLTENEDLSTAIFLFHSPPYKTNLDRASLDNMFYDHVPLDVHIGSMAIKEFIEVRQPLLTLHGHVHESSRITGEWKEEIGNTMCFNAAIEQNELSIVIFETENLNYAIRKIY